MVLNTLLVSLTLKVLQSFSLLAPYRNANISSHCLIIIVNDNNDKPGVYVLVTMGRVHPRVGSGRVHLCGSVSVTLDYTKCCAKCNYKVCTI